MPAKIELGTLIHGTLRDEDLLQAFSDELRRIEVDRAPLTDTAYRWINFLNDNPDSLEDTSGDLVSDIVPEIINDLMDALNEYAPTGYYFGAIEGDGSDFGFWAIEEED